MLLYIFKIFYFLDRGEGREKEREKNIDVWEKHLTCPNQGPGLQPTHLPWLVIEPVTFQFVGQRPATEPHQSGVITGNYWAWTTHAVLWEYCRRWKKLYYTLYTIRLSLSDIFYTLAVNIDKHKKIKAEVLDIITSVKNGTTQYQGR